MTSERASAPASVETSEGESKRRRIGGISGTPPAPAVDGMTLVKGNERGYWEGGTENFTWERAKRWHEERSTMTTTQTQIRTLPLDALVFSQTPMQTERRKMRTAEQISDRAESIRSVGVLQPILVRPLNDPRVHHQEAWEIAAGEGRVLSAKEAGLTEIPAIVRELTDEQVEEIQLIENLQRDDVHELVEALGYETLERHGHSVDEIAAKIGKSKATIYARMKLLALGEKARGAFLAGKLNASVALLVARIPVEDLQEKALEEILDAADDDSPLGFRGASNIIRQKYTTHLSRAPFPTDHVGLIENVGTCAACPKRTGNQPELFGDISDADVCTDPVCFGQKRKAWIAIAIEKAKEEGRRVIVGNPAKKIAQYGQIFGGYADISHTCFDDPKHRSWKQLLGKDYVPDLVEMPESGELKPVVHMDTARQLLADKGILKLPMPKATTPTAAGSREKPAALSEEEERVDAETEQRLLMELSRKDGGKLAREHVEYLFAREIVGSDLSSDEVNSCLRFALERRHSDEGVMKQIAKVLPEKALHRAIIDLIYRSDLQYYDGKMFVEPALKRLKIERKKIRAEVTAALKAPPEKLGPRKGPVRAEKSTKKKAGRK